MPAGSGYTSPLTTIKAKSDGPISLLDFIQAQHKDANKLYYESTIQNDDFIS